MATSVRADRDVVDQLGPPPTFVVITDRPTFDVEVATDPILFGEGNRRRRNSKNFWASTTGESIASVPAGASVQLPRAAWLALRIAPYLYYRAIGHARPGEQDLSFDLAARDLPPFLFVPPKGTVGHTLTENLSGAQARLTATGNRVISVADPLVLRGVNRSGMEYVDKSGHEPINGTLMQDWRLSAGITNDEMAEITGLWGSTIVRVTLNQERALGDESYREDLDEIIAIASRHGAYTLLDLQWFSTARNDANGNVPPLPEENSVRMWTLLAARYRLQPAVLYDIFNEPHVPDPESPFYPYTRPPPSSPAEHDFFVSRWHDWVRRLSSAIWRVNAKALIFVSGFDWGSDLGSYPVAAAGGADLQGCVYSAHWYLTIHGALSPVPAPDPARWRRDFDARIGEARGLRTTHPVFIGEWGGIDPGSKGVTPGNLPALEALALQWGQTLASYLRPLHQSASGVWQGLLGWTAWSWSDNPLLVRRGPLPLRLFRLDTLNHHIPTDFGQLVKNELSH